MKKKELERLIESLKASFDNIESKLANDEIEEYINKYAFAYGWLKQSVRSFLTRFEEVKKVE